MPLRSLLPRLLPRVKFLVSLKLLRRILFLRAWLMQFVRAALRRKLFLKMPSVSAAAVSPFGCLPRQSVKVVNTLLSVNQKQLWKINDAKSRARHTSRLLTLIGISKIIIRTAIFNSISPIIFMFKAVIKWLLQVCFKAVIGEIFIEYEKRKEVSYETTSQTSEEGEQKNLHDGR